MVDRTVVHFEIPAGNVQKLGSFCSGLFSWRTEKTWLALALDLEGSQFGILEACKLGKDTTNNLKFALMNLGVSVVWIL